MLCIFSIKVNAQCVGCVTDTTNCSGPTGAVCPDILPDADAGFAYDQDVTFNMVTGLVIPGIGISLEVTNVEVIGVAGLPQGLDYTLSATQFDPEENDPASQYGCFKVCGVPCAGDGTYTIQLLLNYTASVVGFPISLEVPFEVALTVNAPYQPLEILSTANYLCPGGTIDLVANDTHSVYNWSNGGSNINIQVNSVGVYGLEVRDTINGNVCVQTDSIEIQDFAPDAGADITICENEITQISASGADFYSWSPGANLSDSTAANPVVLYLDTTTTFTLTGYNDSCSSSTEQITVTVDNNCPQVCQDCEINESCPNIITTQAVCPGVLPTATANQSYETDFSFNFPYEFDITSILPIPIPIPGAFDNITIEYVSIDDINQLPSGLSWESDQSAAGDIYYPGLVDGVTGRGCISICGQLACVPAGTYSLEMNTVLGLEGIPASLQGIINILIPGFNNGELELPVSLTMEVVYDNPLTVTPSGTVNLDFGESVTLTASTNGLSNHTWSNGESGPEITVSETGQYTVTANDGSCNQSVSVQVNVAEDPVGIDELDFQYLDIFPNPTMSEFVISWESTDRIDVLRIYNMQGKIMHEEQLKSNVEQKTISAASWAAGVYFIELTGAKGTVQKKLIKQ